MQPWPTFPDPTAPSLPRQSGPAGPTGPTGPAGPTGPTQALAALMDGNRRVAAGAPRDGRYLTGDRDVRPYALVLGCIDARVPVEAVFDQEPGAICVARTAGHVLDRAVTGSIEFAVTDLGVRLVLVLGHSRCAAVSAALSAAGSRRRSLGGRGYLIDAITPGLAEITEGGDKLDQAVRAHVRRTVSELARIPLLTNASRQDSLNIAGAVFHLDGARVELV